MSLKDNNKRPRAGQQLRMSDIARLAGVDTSTVSRALAGSSRVTKETRDRIHEIVRNTGYVVNRNARMLRDGLAHQILIIIPDIGAMFYPDVVKGAEEIAYNYGVNVLLGSTRRDPGRESKLGEQLLTGAVDGVLTITGSVPESVRSMPDYKQRIVALSRPVDEPGIPCVSIDNAAATQQVLEYLWNLGHRNILHIGGPQTSAVFRARAEAYRLFMHERGLASFCRVREVEAFSFASGTLNMAEILVSVSDRPTAVFCATDDLAIGAMAAARDAGLSVPSDLSVVGFDDLILSSLSAPKLTTVHIPRVEIGRHGAELLFARMAGATEGDICLPFKLIRRDSCAQFPS